MKALQGYILEAMINDKNDVIQKLNKHSKEPFEMLKYLFDSKLKPIEIYKLLSEYESIFIDWVKKNFTAFKKIPLKLECEDLDLYDGIEECDEICINVVADTSNSRSHYNDLLTIRYSGFMEEMAVVVKPDRNYLKYPKSSIIDVKLLKKIDFDELDANKENVMKKYGMEYDDSVDPTYNTFVKSM